MNADAGLLGSKKAKLSQKNLLTREASYKFPTGDADPQRRKLCYDAAVVGTEVGVSLVR
jgi:hypothetical protein